MNQVINLNIDSEQEEAQIDLTLEPQISKEKAAPKATLATMAADSLKDYDPYPRTTEDKFQNYLDIYSYGDDDLVKEQIAQLKLLQIAENSNILSMDAINRGEKEAAKDYIDFNVSIDKNKLKDTVIEQQASEQIISGGFKDSDRASIAVDQMTTENSWDDAVQDFFEGSMFTNKQIQNRLDKVGLDLDTFTDGLKILIPGFNSLYHSQNLKTKINPWLVGNDLKEQKATWDSMSLSEKSEAAKEINKLFDDRDDDINALIFWSYMADLNEFDVFAENSIAVMEATIVGKPLATFLSKYLKVGRVVDLLNKGKLATVSAKVGNRKDAVEQVKAIEEGIEAGEISKNSKAASEAADLTVDSQLLVDPELSVGLSGRLKSEVEDTERLVELFTNAPKNRYLDTKQQAEAIIQAGENLVEDVYYATKKTPADIGVVMKTEEITSDIVGNPLYRISYGAEGNKGFPTSEAAMATAKRMKIPDASIVPFEENGTWFFKVDRRLQNHGDFVLTYDLKDIVAAGGTRRWAVNTNQLVDKATQKAAHLTLATREQTTFIGAQLVKKINKLNKNEKVHLSEVMELGRNEQKWFSFNELKNNYKLNDKQISAYHALRRMDDVEYFVDNGLRYGRLERQGFRSVELKSEFSLSKEIGEFNGRVIEQIVDPSNKSIFNGSTGKYVNDLSSEELTKLQKNGYKIVALEGARDMSSTNPIQFIIAKAQDLQIKGLNPKQIEYLPGGRLHYQEGFYVKQGRLRNGPGYNPATGEGVRIMLAPKTYGVATRAESLKYAEEMEAGRKIALASGTNKQMSLATAARFNTIKSYIDFVGSKNLDMPFEVVQDGDDLVSVNKLINEGKATALAEDLKMGNSMQRMLRTRGSKQSRRGKRLNDFTGEAAPVINPIESASMSLTRAVRNMTVQTWKDKQIAKFYETFKGVLKGDKTPKQHFENPEYFQSKEASTLIKQAQVMQEHYKRILNTPTVGEETIRGIISTTMDAVLPKLGVRERVIKNINKADPITFARWVTYQEKLGMFNLAQPFTQLQTSVLIATASPIHGPRAAALTPYLRMMLFSDNPTTLGKIASSVIRVLPGINSKIVKEAFDVVNRSASWRLGAGTLAEQDLAKGFSSGNIASKLIEFGTVPFLESERFNKITATTTAYLEWKSKNKTAKITDDVIDSIRTRGETLALSMNRVDQAAWQRGISGTITQFWGYQARNMESWLPTMVGGSKNFTRTEKISIALGQLSLYGVGGTLGIGTGFSLINHIREEYKNQFGEDISEDVLKIVEKGFIDGIFLTALGLDVNTHYRTGLGLTTSGWGQVIYNIANIENWDKLLTVESAPLSTASENIQGIVNIFTTLSAVGSNITTKYGFNMAAESFGNFFRTNISSYSRAERAYMAMKSGIYYDRLLSPKAEGLSNWEAVGIIFGFDPSITQDTRAIQELIIKESKLHSNHVDTLVRSMRKAVQDNDLGQFDFDKNIILNTIDDPEERVKIMQRVISKVQKNKNGELFRQFLQIAGPDAFEALGKPAASLKSIIGLGD